MSLEVDISDAGQWLFIINYNYIPYWRCCCFVNVKNSLLFDYGFIEKYTINKIVVIVIRLLFVK